MVTCACMHFFTGEQINTYILQFNSINSYILKDAWKTRKQDCLNTLFSYLWYFYWWQCLNICYQNKDTACVLFIQKSDKILDHTKVSSCSSKQTLRWLLTCRSILIVIFFTFFAAFFLIMIFSLLYSWSLFCISTFSASSIDVLK